MPTVTPEGDSSRTPAPWRRPGEPSTAELAAQVRTRIAAASDEGAALVAAYEEAVAARAELAAGTVTARIRARAAVMPSTPQHSAERQRRITAYGALLARGMTRQAAAAGIGVSVRTAEQYETEWRQSQAGDNPVDNRAG